MTEEDAVLLAELYVDERHVGSQRRDELERLRAGERGRHHVEPLGTEQAARCSDEILAVVDDQATHLRPSIATYGPARNEASGTSHRPACGSWNSLAARNDKRRRRWNSAD